MRVNFPNISVRPGSATILLVVLIAVDCFFWVMHMLRSTELVQLRGVWSLQRDASYSEYFQYLKFGYLAVSSYRLFHKFRSKIYLAFGMLFTLALADDAFFIHEGLGDTLARLLNLPEHVGELVFFGAIGILPLIFVLYAFVAIDDAVEKAFARDILILFSMLAGVAIGLDFFFSHVSRDSSWLRRVLGILDEDFLEMLILSLIVWTQFKFRKTLTKAKMSS